MSGSDTNGAIGASARSLGPVRPRVEPHDRALRPGVAGRPGGDGISWPCNRRAGLGVRLAMARRAATGVSELPGRGGDGDEAADDGANPSVLNSQRAVRRGGRAPFGRFWIGLPRQPLGDGTGRAAQRLGPRFGLTAQSAARPTRFSCPS